MFKRIKLFLIMIGLLFANLEVASNVQSGSLPTIIGQEQKSLTTSIVASAEEQKAALEMWTRATRLAAQPLAFPVESSTEANANQDAEELLLLPPGSVMGGSPNPQADISAQKEFPEEWQQLIKDLEVLGVPEQAVLDNKMFLPIILNPASEEGEDSPNDDVYGTGAIFTSYRTNYHLQMLRHFPFHAVGKLYITGGGYCTASVISPNNIIVTAAHCVYDTENNRWLSGWTFVPADRAGVAPYGTFPWVSATVLNSWINASGTVRRYDVAVITLGNNSAGLPVTFYTGWLGRSWNFGSVQHHHAVGYPGALDSGLYTYICAAESFSGGTDVLSMGCNMEFGSSGGPWIRGFTPYIIANNWVNSVVSGGTPGSNTFSGARFSDTNIVPLCNAAGC